MRVQPSVGRRPASGHLAAGFVLLALISLQTAACSGGDIGRADPRTARRDGGQPAAGAAPAPGDPRPAEVVSSPPSPSAAPAMAAPAAAVAAAPTGAIGASGASAASGANGTNGASGGSGGSLAGGAGPAIQPAAANLPSDPSPALPPPHAVEPQSDEDLARKRAEWAEHERQEAERQAQLIAWQRSREVHRTAAPRVGFMPGAAAAQSAVDPTAVAVRAWYRGYSRRATAVSLAMSRFNLAADAASPDARRLAQACQELLATANAAIGDPTALAAPLPSIGNPLTIAYGEIAAAATSCLDNQADERAVHLATARQRLAEAATALQRYHLRP